MKVNVAEREELARKNHKEGMNCAQAVVMAYADLVDMKPEVLKATAAPFGRGLCGRREVCGCVSGMAMLSQLLVAGVDKESTKKSQEITEEMLKQYETEHGDIICRNLLAILAREGKKVTCTDRVGSAARILGEKLNSLEQE